MKKLPLLMFAAGCLAITSCSSDDDSGSNNNGNVTADLVGTYDLTAATAASAQDYDGDGDSNTNLSLEGSCYNESWISFHNDGTYDESYTSSTTSEGGLSLDCQTKVSSGTYTQNGDTITTNRTSGTGSGSATATFTFNAAAHTLTRTDSNSSYSGWNAASSLWANLTGNLNLTFTKYTNNDNDNGNSDDDDDNVSTDGRAEIIGNFGLTALLTGSAQDLNNDGNSSTNLLTETNCYASSHITFNNDGTYTEESSSSSLLSSLGLALTCNSSTHTGTFIRNGNNIVTRMTSGSGTVTTNYTLNTENNTISRSDSSGSYPTFNSVTNLFAMTTGSLSYTFTKSGSSN
ncbi:hypothetical protein [Flavobacterium sp. 3HN19-14]|uniref:hypothetical protein n=1 Tax=Flavobacterium sp. 3HN19-14 TaxID=3448133 RepID=UPI003EDF6A8F